MKKRILVITSLRVHSVPYSDTKYEFLKNAEVFMDEKVCYVILLDDNYEAIESHGSTFADVAAFSLN